MSSSLLINDPLYGFISTDSDLVIKLINHPYFQRLRRIKQLGLIEFVYPGATHTRFHHAIGALHLADKVIVILKEKNIPISSEEKEALEIAVLLHDIGHGPFSHTLEKVFLCNEHEEISLAFMQLLNLIHDGQLTLAIDMYTNKYNRPFFHQIINGQLDVDRLDYLQRDAYYTGVVEGNIGVDVLIKLLNVHNDKLVIEEKGIYPIESFLCSRRVMSWQVYMHKTAVGAEKLLLSILSRVKELYSQDKNNKYLELTNSLEYFLSFKNKKINISDIIESYNNIALHPKKDTSDLDYFSDLDDFDIMASVKRWTLSKDKVLSTLSTNFLNRRLFKCQIMTYEPDKSQIKNICDYIINHFNIEEKNTNYFFHMGKLYNHAYNNKKPFMVLTKGKTVKDVAIMSDLPNIRSMEEVVTKHYLCWMR